MTESQASETPSSEPTTPVAEAPSAPPEAVYTQQDFVAQSEQFDKVDHEGNLLHRVQTWDVAGIFKQAGDKLELTEAEFRDHLARWRGEKGSD